MNPNHPSEQRVAEVLYEVVQAFQDEPVWKRMRMRLRELGANCKDEQKQFRVLQRACREDAEFKVTLDARVGFDITAFDPRKPDPRMGLMMQGFNHMVEDMWDPF